MPRITFKSAPQRNPGRDGLDIMFMYTMSSSNEVFGIRATGRTNSWNMTDQQKSEYAQILFTGVIDYIKKYWSKNKKLPARNAEIYEGSDFIIDPAKKTSWEEYSIDLG